MDRYYGFDLGDAESAVSCLNKNDAGVPRIITVGEAGSFVTAYARLRNGALVIGEAACYNPEAVERKIRFKSRFLRDPDSRRDVKSFAAGVLGELYMSGDLVKGEDCCFYVGCPAGWDKTARERYRGLFEEAGYPPVRIISLDYYTPTGKTTAKAIDAVKTDAVYDTAQTRGMITDSIETSMTATRNYSTGDLLIVGSALYKATQAIANGGPITEGTNVSRITLAQYITELLQ